MGGTPELLFGAANLAAMLGWACLAALPLFGRRRRLGLGLSRLAVAMIAGLYVALVARALASGGGAAVDFTSLAGVAALLAAPGAAVALWSHYLALDLLGGAWMAEDAPAAGVGHALLLPCLVLTLFAGPAGVLLYLVVKGVRRRGRRR